MLPAGSPGSPGGCGSGTYVPVEGCDVLVAGHVLPALADAVPQHQLRGAARAVLAQVPDPRRRVSGSAKHPWDTNPAAYTWEFHLFHGYINRHHYIDRL